MSDSGLLWEGSVDKMERRVIGLEKGLELRLKELGMFTEEEQPLQPVSGPWRAVFWRKD